MTHWGKDRQSYFPIHWPVAKDDGNNAGYITYQKYHTIKQLKFVHR